MTARLLPKDVIFFSKTPCKAQRPFPLDPLKPNLGLETLHPTPPYIALHTVDDINPAFPLRTLNYGKYGNYIPSYG